MNDATQNVITFLNRPELDLGGSPLDVEIVRDPTLLRERVESLLAQASSQPTEFPEEDLPTLQKKLDDVDWNRVTGEMAERLRLVGVVFDGDARDAFT